MNILEIGIEHGKELGVKQGLEQGMEQGLERGLEQGTLKTIVKNVETAMKNWGLDLPAACKGLEITVEEYEEAKKQISAWKK